MKRSLTRIIIPFKNTMKIFQRLIIQLSAIGAVNPLIAQTLSVPNFVPQTPEVTWNQRFGDIPVSEYTGVPSISIPLHSIKIRETEYPMSLDYHAGGIKVKDESSWVGLGWNLTNWGTITVEAVGGPDNDLTFADNSDWQLAINYRTSAGGLPRRYWGTLMPMMNCGVDDPDSPIPNENVINESLYGSGERDLYHANFLGKSIKFYISPISNDIVLVGEKKPYIIQKTNSGWKVVDDLGFQYFFNANEYYQYDASGNQMINTWHLTHVVYQGKELMKINYSTFHCQMLPQMSDKVVDKQVGTLAVERTLSHINEFAAKYPQYLVSALDSIVFVMGTRVDLRNAPALNFIRIYNRKKGDLVKTIELQKDYFSGITMGAEPSTLDYITKRLRLHTLLIKSTGSEAQKYSFTYNEQLPYKTSFSQDFWGYYNGEDNLYLGNILGDNIDPNPVFSRNRTLLPTAESLIFEENIPNSRLKFKAANRGVNETHATAGALKSITYPTGGRTEFEYESNRVNNVTYVKSSQSLGTTYYQRVIDNRNLSFSTPMVRFTVTEEVMAKIKVVIKAGTYNLTDFNAFSVTLVTKVGSPTPISKRYYIMTDEHKQQFNQTRSVTIEEDVLLPIGDVVLATSVEGNIPDQGYSFINGVIGELTYYDGIDTSQVYDSYIGGLRIKRIRNYESNNVLTGTKSYEYEEDDGKPSGKLIYPMRFFNRQETRFQKLISVEGGHPIIFKELIDYDFLYSDNYYNYAKGYSSSHIGYSRVVIRDLDGQEVSEGVTIKSFYNIAVTNYYEDGKNFIPADIYNHAVNGKLRKLTHFNKNADSVFVEEYFYAIKNTGHNYVNVYITDLYDGPRECAFRTSLLHSNRFDVTISAYSNFNVQLERQDTRQFLEGGQFSVRETYKYDPYIYKLSEVVQIASDGVNIIENTKYPKNFTSATLPLYGVLVGANMVGIPIEKTTLKGNKVVDYSRVDYGTWGSVVAPQHYYRKNTDGNTYRIATFSLYDDFGNPLEFQEYNGPITSYLWGYNGQYLVAKVENAGYTAITNTGVNVSVLNSLTSAETAKSIELAKIRSHATMGKAQVSTFTYRPLIGMSSSTDVSGRTTWYDYDGFGRLWRTRDQFGNVIEEYKYNYRQ